MAPVGVRDTGVVQPGYSGVQPAPLLSRAYLQAVLIIRLVCFDTKCRFRKTQFLLHPSKLSMKKEINYRYILTAQAASFLYIYISDNTYVHTVGFENLERCAGIDQLRNLALNQTHDLLLKKSVDWLGGNETDRLML